MERVGRIPTPHDDQLAVGEGVILVAVLDGAEGHVRRKGCALIAGHRPRIGAAAEHAEKARQQTLDLIRLVQYAVGRARVCLVKNGRRAVFLLQLDHFDRNMIQRLVPGYALEFSLAAFADAHHRVEQALGRIKARTVRTSAQAGAQLRLGEGVLAELSPCLVAAVVGGQAHDDVAPFVRDQHVARTAVVVAGRHDGGELIVRGSRVHRRRPAHPSGPAPIPADCWSMRAQWRLPWFSGSCGAPD